MKDYDFEATDGLHKKVGIEEIVNHAHSNGIETMSVISSGNFVKAICDAIDDETRVVNLVNKPKVIHSNADEIVLEPHRILRNEEERATYTKEQLRQRGIETTVHDYTDFMPQALRERARDIISTKPLYIGVGIGSGRLYVALYDAIEESKSATKLVGFLPRGENGVFNDQNLFETEGKLYFHNFNPKSIADKLVTPYTQYKEQILQSLEKSHKLIEVGNREFKKANQFAKKRGLHSEPSGSAGFCIYDKTIQNELGILDENSIMAINTGKGYFKKPFPKVQSIAAALVLGVSSIVGFQNVQEGQDIAHMHRLGATNVAAVAAKILNQTIHPQRMSTEELYAYASNASEKIGGPPQYWGISQEKNN